MKPDFRDLVAMLLVGQFIVALALLFFVEVPTSNKEQVIFMLGYSAAMATAAAGYYFGSSKSDGSKTDNTGKAFDAISAVANKPGVTIDPPATIQVEDPRP